MFFFFNDTATTEICTLSLLDALPISPRDAEGPRAPRGRGPPRARPARESALDRRATPARLARGGGDRSRSRCALRDRKSTRLNSSHANISYAVLCLKKTTKLSQSHPC